jgi:hypothetical protein
MERTNAPTQIDPWEGVELSIDTLRPINHRAAWETTRSLCRSFAKMYPEAGLMIDPLDVVEVLKQSGVRFVLMGAHGIGGWMNQARATRDVDVVVRKADHKKALKAVRESFPELILDEHAVVSRLLDPQTGEPLIDLMRPVNLFAHVFDNSVLTDAGHQVPNVEMAIASKFSALVSRNRPEEKLHLDASDFIQMVKRNHERLDRDRLRQLGDAVYPGGGEELSHRVDDVLAGRRLRFERVWDHPLFSA